jgi:hypothetical protein
MLRSPAVLAAAGAAGGGLMKLKSMVPSPQVDTIGNYLTRTIAHSRLTLRTHLFRLSAQRQGGRVHARILCGSRDRPISDRRN